MGQRSKSSSISKILSRWILIAIITCSCCSWWVTAADDAGSAPIHMCGEDEDGSIEEGCECNDDKQLIICDNVIYITSKDDLGTPLSTPNIEIENGAFNEMERLEVLDLGNNRLQKIDPNWFVGVKWNLKYLNLENNSLVSLTDDVFKAMPMLQSLILDGNPKLFDKKNSNKFHLGTMLSDLRNLSMNGCKINNLTEDFFANLTKLEVLSLASNYFVTVPLAIKTLPSLLFLDLSETYITEISESELTFNKQLQSFYCTDCSYLEFVSDCAFCGLKDLKSILTKTIELFQEIDFRGCIQLSVIDEGAFGYGHNGEKLPQLEFLSIHETNLSSLSGRAFDSSKLSEFYFGDTFWDCKCGSSWILKLNLDVVKGPKCQTPERLFGKQFMKLDEQDLCPARTRFTKLILSLFVIILSVFVTLLVWYVLSNYRIRNIFYRPELPHIGYSNLNRVEEEEQQRQ
uniref:LRRCT domain-containing protein n=1 Tax=Syphacia muris TaxID=451379 RepID=A0A0N5AHR8_9BILA